MPTATTKEKVRALVAAQLGGASYFLKIDGIRGESQDRQHKDEIELQSFAWGNSNAEPQAGASGIASGKVTFQDFQFAAPASKAGPQVMLQCATGQRMKRAIMTGRREQLLGSSLVITHSHWLSTSRQTTRSPRRLIVAVESHGLTSVASSVDR